MTHLVLNNSGIRHLFKNPRGPIAKVINEKAERIRSAAETNIKTKTSARSGDLEGALRKIPREGAEFYHVVVGSDATHRGFPYARALETGINPLTGADMNFKEDKSFMVPAVRSAGFRLRRA